MGLTQSNISTIFKPFECLAHFKLTAKSPCCKQCCDGGDHCTCSLDTHNYDEEISVISD